LTSVTSKKERSLSATTLRVKSSENMAIAGKRTSHGFVCP
jgi:hypothetical protein